MYITPFNLFPKSEFSSYEKYADYVSKLPKSIRTILVSSITADFIEDQLRPQFNLTEAQSIQVTEIIRDILLANLFIGDMTNSIKEEAGLTPENAKKISDMIVGQLFAPAIQDIKQIQKENFPDRLSGGGQPAQSPSSQTINLRSQAPTPPKPAPIDPIIASLKTSQDTPRPASPQPSQPASMQQPQTRPPQFSPQPQQNRPPQPTAQPQPNPQKTQNVFKIPDIDFGSDQSQAQPKQEGQKNVLDLRDQK